ncbi:MAG TPA: hypothetical protein PK893_08550, partial [Candidatus Competibacteraceae bacterium]|nr:hypothetical protein [Candidatus Competibacteraceae bacterium]
MQSKRQTRLQDAVATVITVAVHAVVIVFLLLNLNISSALHTETPEIKSIQAEVIDEETIRLESERLAEEERRRQQIEAERQARLAQAEREAAAEEAKRKA